MRSIWLCSAVLLLFPHAAPQGKPRKRAEIDLGAGIAIGSLEPRKAPLPSAALARVAEHVGRPVAELQRAKLYTGVVRIRSGPEQPCDLVSVPLSGPAAGGRVDLAVRDGELLTCSVRGALDLDEDPTGRWEAFLIQLQSTWSLDRPEERRRVTLASPPARHLAGRLAPVQEDTVQEDTVQKDEDGRLARILMELRMTMRKNASMNLLLVRLRKLPRVEWLARLSAEMERAARLAPELAPLLGEEGAREYARLARDLAATYADYQSLLGSVKEADRDEIEPDLAHLGDRAGATCTQCHASTGAKDWRRLFSKKRGELGVAETQLVLGYDVAPALGDDGKVSREIVDKLRAGMLLVEAARQ
jgi:hypothetical protein